MGSAGVVSRMTIGWDGRFAAPEAAAPLPGSNRVRLPIPHSAGKQKGPTRGPFCFLAERVGFEPTKGYKPLLVFKTSAFNRSATSPNCPVPRVGWIRRLRRLTPSGRTSCVLARCASQSNPRKATNLCWFSRPVHSTALPPLRRTVRARALCLQCRFDSTRAGAIPRTPRGLAGLIPRHRLRLSNKKLEERL